MRPAMLLLLFLTGVAAAQAPQINVPRDAYPYELLDSMPEGIRDADRQSVTDFLAVKGEARAAFETEIQDRICPQYLEGDLTTAEVAFYLDQEAKWMNAVIASAYDELVGRLSVDGSAAVATALERADVKPSADTRMVDVEEASPEAFERILGHMCRSE